jgi:hypothetical protein
VLSGLETLFRLPNMPSGFEKSFARSNSLTTLACLMMDLATLCCRSSLMAEPERKTLSGVENTLLFDLGGVDSCGFP